MYLGTADPPAFQGTRTETSFHPAALEPGTQYFWRIDTVGESGTTAGEFWTFTTGHLPADFDIDGDVDQADFGYLQACISGAGVFLLPGCEMADLHPNGVVDQQDVAVFRNCIGGANQHPGC